MLSILVNFNKFFQYRAIHHFYSYVIICIINDIDINDDEYDFPGV